MNTQRSIERRDEEGIANVEEQDNQVPQLKEYVMDDQVFVVPPSVVDGDIRVASLKMSQVIKTKNKSSLLKNNL